MSERKLQKYLKRSLPPVIGNKTLTPIVLTDSKGRYLHDFCHTEVELEIRWRYKSGRTSHEGLKWLRDNLNSEIGRLDNIHLYIWLGTCDLTNYNGQFISLSTDEGIIPYIIAQYQEIINLFKQYPACKITFFEIPPYSIIDFNKTRGHQNPSSYKKDEELLLQKVDELNNHIRYINSTLNTFSPNLSVDLSQHHQSKTSKQHKLTLRDNYMFQLYKDGIHPLPTLAKVWLRKIALHIQKDCWSEEH